MTKVLTFWMFLKNLIEVLKERVDLCQCILQTLPINPFTDYINFRAWMILKCDKDFEL